MSSKKPRGHIHKIQEFELEKISLIDEFDILQIVGEGWFGKILLVEHRASQTEMVLKAVPKPYVSLREFYREFHYGLHLGIHRNIVTTFDVAFETAGFYVFTQEYAPLGDLTSNVTDTGVGEVYSKRVAKQIASAIDYMHSKDIVHRDVKLDNILIYRSDFSKVKLCDFGESFQTGTLVERRNEWLPYSPPEILDVKTEDTYKADPSHDVWQFAIVIFVCLTGCLPWQKAASDDPRYMRYLAWQGSIMLPIRRTPKLYKLLSSKAQRMFRRFLEPRADKRPKNLTDVGKFIDDRWLAKTAEKEMAEFETDELCPSMYSFHSSPDEKHRLLYTLADCGIETNVDRLAKKNRIKDWIESSVITEEDEEEDTNSASASSSLSREPVAGHISSIRAAEKTKEIKTTLKDASQKHFDPRTGALQQGPSEMGVVLTKHDKSPSFSQMSDLSTMNNNASLNSSLMTLGSRQDLITSNLQMYNSMETELNRLGEHNSFDEGFVGPALSSDNLQHLADDFSTMHISSFQTNKNLTKNSLVVGTQQPSNRPKSILHRSKSDSVKTALFASSPSINQADAFNVKNVNKNNNNLLYYQQLQKQQQQQDLSSFAPNSGGFFQPPGVVNGKAALSPRQNKSVTFTGLANNLQTLTSLSLGPLVLNNQNNINNNNNSFPNNYNNQNASSMLQNQQQKQQAQLLQQNLQNTYYHYQNNSPVKDSAYSSLETNELSSSPVKQGQYQDQLKQHLSTKTVTSVRTQTSQQQRVYNGATIDPSIKNSNKITEKMVGTSPTRVSDPIMATSMDNVPNRTKDSAYDRVLVSNKARKRR